MEKRKIVLTTGVHDPSARDQWEQPSSKLYQLGRERPFTQQLDVVFSAKEGLQSFLEQKSTSYCKWRCKMTDFIEFAKRAVNDGIECYAVGSSSATHDVWCLVEGVLTLSIGKETYEQFGVASSGALPWKPYQYIHVVQISLVTEEASAQLPHGGGFETHGSYAANAQMAFERWDRELGSWDVVISSSDISQLSAMTGMESRQVIPQVRNARQVHIPKMPLPTLSQAQSPKDANDVEEVAALFEWVGLACFDSPRLRANDSVDPYLAVYDPPLEFTIEDLVHVRWTGLLTPPFVQSVVDDTSFAGFVAITGQSVTSSPVTHKPINLRVEPSRLRLPNKDGEDTWCLIITEPQNGESGGNRQWMMTDSIGSYDNRL